MIDYAAIAAAYTFGRPDAPLLFEDAVRQAVADCSQRNRALYRVKCVLAAVDAGREARAARLDFEEETP